MSKFSNTAKICIENGFRLLDDAEMLEYSDPPSSAFALAIIAQEEFAKAFLFYLVSINVIPWNKFVHRATRDHACKHLIGIILDYLNPDIDEFMNRAKKRSESPERKLPPHVADAINIFRHEKIGRWVSPNWFWDVPPDYDAIAKKIADGYLDKRKQNSLYVNVSKTGAVLATPKVLKESLEDVFEKARNMGHFTRDLFQQEQIDLDYQSVKEAFEVVFASFESITAK